MHITLEGNTVTTQHARVERVTLSNHHVTLCPVCFTKRCRYLHRTTGYTHTDTRCDSCRRIRDCATATAR